MQLLSSITAIVLSLGTVSPQMTGYYFVYPKNSDQIYFLVNIIIHFDPILYFTNRGYTVHKFYLAPSLLLLSPLSTKPIFS